MLNSSWFSRQGNVGMRKNSFNPIKVTGSSHNEALNLSTVESLWIITNMIYVRSFPKWPPVSANELLQKIRLS